MNKRISKIDQNDVLKQMEKNLVENEIAAKFEEGNSDEPSRLYVMFDNFGVSLADVVGQFYFEDHPEANGEMLYLASLYLLSEVTVDEHFPELCHAIAIINSKMPCGCFTLSMDDKTLAYRLVTPVSSELSFEQLDTQLNAVMSNSMNVSEGFCDLLFGVMNGELTAEDIKSAFASL